MTQNTPEQVEKKLEELLASIIENKSLISFLKGCEKWQERWKVLEQHVINHLNDNRLERTDWGLDTDYIGFLRDRFFYEMQQRTEMSFGFCPYFKPAYKERTKYFLEGQKEDPEKNWNKCAYGGDAMLTTCVGTQIDVCVHLHPERRRFT
jgi:hypothetical protein